MESISVKWGNDLVAFDYKVGDMLYLQLDESDDAKPITYKARIADMTNENLIIEMPISEESGRMGIFPSSSALFAWFYVDGGAKLTFETKVLGRKKENIPLVILAHPDPQQIRKTQRRNFLRVACKLEIAIHPEEDGEFEPFVTKTMDLSGGGLSFQSQDGSLKEKTKVKWWLSIPIKNEGIVHPHGLGTIIRRINPENTKTYIYPLSFDEVTEVDRQKIMRYCFLRQLELRQKGL